MIDSLSDKKFTHPPEVIKIPNEAPFHPLADRQTIRGEGVDMQVLHTPGHSADSICLYLPEDTSLFTADSILGHGTAVFENLSLYMRSLQSLLSFEYPSPGLQKIYPGHGPVIESGAKDVIKEYISHRLEREQQILRVFESKPDSWWTLDEIVGAIYPPEVRDMAKRGVLLHLDKLESDGKVTRKQDEIIRWKIITNN
jgi:glyoxylase-like metal-dependent hydrolase (beta-lactamase superfamily II)